MKHLAWPVIWSVFFLPSVVTSAPSGGMTEAQLTDLLKNGATLQLGGEGQGYSGSLKLNKNGKGNGKAKTDDGTEISLKGTWSIKGDQFCRKWKGIDGGNEVCETWVLTSPRSVDVYNGDQKIGVNSW